MTTPEDLQNARRASLVAPAGCGKTELIARAVATGSDTRELILTHTHAGVAALRQRLKKNGVSSARFRVDTVAGFALRIAASYPLTSGLTDVTPRGASWNLTYGAASRVLSKEFGTDLLRSSFSGMYVDEYQDCTLEQHQLILQMAETLPCRLVGDPLQGIFDFAGRTVSWPDDIDPTFERLESLGTPWRWMEVNPELGEWLLQIRAPLQAGQVIDVSNAPIGRGEAIQASQIRECSRQARLGGSVVAIRKWARDAHDIARGLGGQFNSMEEMDCNDLVKFAEHFEEQNGKTQALAVIAVASSCMTGVSDRISSMKSRLESGYVPSSPLGSALVAVTSAISLMAESSCVDWESVLLLLSALEALSEVRVFRRELLAELRRAIRMVLDEGAESLSEAVWMVRDQARHRGRWLEPRLISRTLLIKGLEFDRGILLQAEEFNARELYVGLTRASRALTVLTSSGGSVLRYKGSVVLPPV